MAVRRLRCDLEPSSGRTLILFLAASPVRAPTAFSPIATDLAAFRRFQFVEGEELLTAYLGTNTEIGGFTEAAPALGLRPVPTLFAGAAAFGPG